MFEKIARWRARASGAAYLIILLLADPPAHGQESARYTVTIEGQTAGQLVRSEDAQRRVRVDFSYRDNGRGPDLVEEFSLDAAGTAEAYAARGKSTFGGEIRDSFTRSGGEVAWRSLVDEGRRADAAEALYLPVEYSAEWIAHLVRTTWARPDHSAAALPAGRFSVERIDSASVRDAQGAAQVALYALVGSNLTPDYVWLREDAGNALFAMVYPGWELVAQGFEAEGARLLERQRRADAQRLHALAERLAKPLPGMTVIHGVRWFDSRAAVMRGPADVCLFDGRISAILAAGQAPLDADHRIDGAGKTLLPGLFDMHAHLYPEDALFQLAAGVTSVRDMGNINSALMDLKGKLDAGTEIGPRVVANGFIEGRSPFSKNFGFVVDSLDAGLRAVDWYHQRGYRQIKLYNSIRPEWVAPLAQRAHRLGMRVSGHVPAFMRAEQAVRAGYDELTHINQVMLNFLVKPADDTRTLLRFSLVGDEAHRLQLDGPRVQAFLRLLRARGTVVDPTLATFEAPYLQRNGQPNPSFSMVSDHLPVAARRGLLSNSTDVNDANAERFRASYATLVEMVGRLYRAGIPLLAGTDNFAGFTLHRELELYVQAGIPAPQVLRIATFNGARYSGTLERLGSIERGKLADLILVDGDPAANISDIRRISLVFKGGVAYAPDEMYEALGIRGFAAAAPIRPGEPVRP